MDSALVWPSGSWGTRMAGGQWRRIWASAIRGAAAGPPQSGRTGRPPERVGRPGCERRRQRIYDGDTEGHAGGITGRVGGRAVDDGGPDWERAAGGRCASHGRVVRAGHVRGRRPRIGDLRTGRASRLERDVRWR